MEEHAGYGNAFDKLWDNTGIVASVTYGTAVLGGLILGIAGATLVLNRKRREGEAEAA